MIKIFGLLAVCLLAINLISPAWAKKAGSLETARKFLINSNSATLLEYKETLKKSAEPSLRGEYALALAYFGLGESALYNIDKALISTPFDCRIRFYLSEILKAFNAEETEVSGECKRPLWLKEDLKLPSLTLRYNFNSFNNFFRDASLLMSQKRYAEAAALFASAPEKFRGHWAFWSGWAITLDKLGAYKSAAEKVEKDILLSENPEGRKTARKYSDSLLRKPPVDFTKKAKKSLKGRYLAYFGGNITGSGGATVYNLNTRFGKFISERIDLSANLGYTGGYDLSDYNGITIGAIARYNAPLKHTPFNVTLAGKIERVPAETDNLSAIISPGLSWFTDKGSFDIYLDISLSGPYSGSPVFSMGYTVYF